MVKAQLRSRNDERSKIAEALAERQNRQMLKENQEIRRFEENEILSAEEAREEAEWDKEEKEAIAEFEAEENRLESPSQVQQLLSEEYGDLWNHAPTRQKMLDEADLAIAEGQPNDDIRTYTKIAEKFRERERQLKNGEIDPNQASREDVFRELEAQRVRQMRVDNAYADAGQQEPQGPEEIRRKISEDYSDFGVEEIQDTVNGVDQAHKEQFVKQGYADNSYRTYEKAAEAARLRALIREREGN